MTNPRPKAARNNVLLFCGSILFVTISLACIAVCVTLIFVGPVVGSYYYAFRANEHYRDGNYEEAIADYTRAINLNQKDPATYLFRGGAYAHLFDYENAKRDFETAIMIAPTWGLAHNNRCWYGSLLGDADGVMESCEEAVALRPDRPGYRDSRGLARALLGDYEGAILDFQYYVDEAGKEDSGIDYGDTLKRIEWIKALKQRINPFDEEEIRELLDGDQGDSVGT